MTASPFEIREGMVLYRGDNGEFFGQVDEVSTKQVRITDKHGQRLVYSVGSVHRLLTPGNGQGRLFGGHEA
mgnify:CR=1 FL=1